MRRIFTAVLLLGTAVSLGACVIAPAPYYGHYHHHWHYWG
jgi:hypothetical protein